jgi:hypothetical protein
MKIMPTCREREENKEQQESHYQKIPNKFAEESHKLFSPQSDYHLCKGASLQELLKRDNQPELAAALKGMPRHTGERDSEIAAHADKMLTVVRLSPPLLHAMQLESRGSGKPVNKLLKSVAAGVADPLVKIHFAGAVAANGRMFQPKFAAREACSTQLEMQPIEVTTHLMLEAANADPLAFLSSSVADIQRRKPRSLSSVLLCGSTFQRVLSMLVPNRMRNTEQYARRATVVVGEMQREGHQQLLLTYTKKVTPAFRFLVHIFSFS